MLCDALEELSDAVFAHVSGGGSSARDGVSLVKMHSDRLQQHGDLSVPARQQAWHQHLGPGLGKAYLQDLLPAALLAASCSWRLPLCAVAEKEERIVMRLLRPRAVAVALLQCFNNINTIDKAFCESTGKVKVDVADTSSGDDLTSLRVRIVCKAVQRLAAIQASKTSRTPDLLFSAKCSTVDPASSRNIICGAVLNLKTGSKETTLTSAEYIQKRQCEMTLIAQHKYGVRISLDNRWKEFLSQLGESAVIYELLQIKPTSAIKINFDNPTSGSSKGASFVLYNCARLETLVKTFNEKVDAGEYPAAPAIEDTDFTLLKDEDEWSLLFNYVLGFPSLLKNSFQVDDGTCLVAPHRVCSFLSALVRTFSHYYRRVRILTEPRQHLLPVMYARLHLLIGLNTTLKMCLRILNIKAVTQM